MKNRYAAPPVPDKVRSKGRSIRPANLSRAHPATEQSAAAPVQRLRAFGSLPESWRCKWTTGNRKSEFWRGS
jgi:hypothetical protein